ncbi:MAG: hypothetical protein ACRD2J_13960, partial [Thermoanaerobaculia bacterium]
SWRFSFHTQPNRTIRRKEPPSHFSTKLGTSSDPMEEALYFRLCVRNWRLTSGERCRVLVRQIRRDGRVIEREASPLSWTDVDTWEPQRIEAGDEKYVDLVSFRKSRPQQAAIWTLKGMRGYHVFSEAGLYEFDVELVADWMLRKRATVTFLHKGLDSCFVAAD